MEERTWLVTVPGKLIVNAESAYLYDRQIHSELRHDAAERIEAR